MFPQKEEVLCRPSECFTLRLGLELEKKLIVNIVSLDLIKHRVNEQKEFLVSRRYAHFSFRQCKVTHFLGILAKNRAWTIEFNRFLDKVLSISPQFLQKI